MKNLFVVAILSAICSFCQAQSSDYAFSVSSNNEMVQMTSPTLLLGSNSDDHNAASIAFPFVFGGKQYQKVFVNTNGFVSLDVCPQEFAFDNYLTEAGTYPVIAVWGDDLTTANNGAVCYQIVGTYPNRQLVIEWKVKKTSDRTSVYNKAFQLWLFEGTGKMQFVYGSAFVDDFNGGGIGLASTATDFVSIDALNNTPNTTEAIVNWGVWPDNTAYVFEPKKTTQPLQVEDILVNHVSCYGKKDGSINLQGITGGNGNYSITWTSENGFVAEGSKIKRLDKDNYTYAITDGEQTIKGLVTINEPTKVSYSVKATNANPINGKGTIDVLTKASYSITNSAGADVTEQKLFDPGAYNLQAYAAGGNEGQTCTTPVATVVIAPANNSISNFFEHRTDVNCLKVFPNPSTGKFTVSVLNSSMHNASISIYTFSGKLVSTTPVSYSKGSQQFNFNLGHLPEGIYIVEYRDGVEKCVAKVVVRK